MSYAINMIAAYMQEKKKPGSLVAGAKEAARLAERKRVDELMSKGRSGTPKQKQVTPAQKATRRRESIMKKVAPASSGYQRLLDVHSKKKKKKE